MSFACLEQRAPGAASEDTLYTVPEGITVHLASISMCNTSGTARTVRLAIVKGGGYTSTANYVLYNCPIPADTMLEWYQAQPVIFNTGDAIRIFASGTGVAFSAFGEEERVTEA